MTQQGRIFGLFINAVNCQSILYTSSRITIAGHQQCAGVKQELIDKIQDLNIPMKPKKPLTSYFRYCIDQRPNVLKKSPNLKFAEITRKIADDWASASDSLKDQYASLYKNEMDSYKKVIDDYNMKLTLVQKEGLELLSQAKKADKKRRLKRKMNKEEARPKRPIGPYMQYFLATYKQAGLKMADALPIVKGGWAALSDSEKDKYKQIYDEEKKRYEVDMNVWEAKMIKEGKYTLVRQSTLNDAKPSRLSKANVRQIFRTESNLSQQKRP